MLAVHVTHDPNSIEPGRSKIRWEDLETFESFVERAFPRNRANYDVTPVKPSKLRAIYFEAHAGIQLQWTEHLYDHLLLSTSENSNVLKVFQIPCMLEAALKVLKHLGPSSAAQRPDAPADNNRDHKQDKIEIKDGPSTSVHDPLQEKHNNDDCAVAGASHVADNEESKL
ncbi:hypothetical protein NUW58_g7082 [Xylaria curta]|uniref:Uncharacterized protein n=1 Tax=Xylaria curta TaxID=42375 RepID=A0ACC1NNB8_9PEZI|nr:hypothetical protein NUW58_g7082 [Xylaria curta]